MAIRPIQDTLRDIREGKMLDDLSIELNDLIRQIRQTDKKGTLTLKLVIEPVKNDASMITIKDQISVAAPLIDKGASLFFTTADANLTRTNPNQPELTGLTDVSKDDAPAIDAWPGNKESTAKEAK